MFVLHSDMDPTSFQGVPIETESGIIEVLGATGMESCTILDSGMERTLA